jgi:hypothetical protein
MTTRTWQLLAQLDRLHDLQPEGAGQDDDVREDLPQSAASIEHAESALERSLA